MQLGGWLGDDGRYVIEVSQQIQDPKAAAEAALERNQNSFWDNAQAKQNDDTKASGVMPDGKMYVPPADPSKGDGLPNPLQLSYGTGDFGVVNPMTKEGVQPIVSPNGDAAIKPSINGRDTASSEGMSQAWRDKAEARMAEAQMPGHQTMADNVTSLVERASAQQWVDGKTFYPRANAEARDIASTTNGIITPYQAAGVIAALSPNTAVGSNMTGASLSVRLSQLTWSCISTSSFLRITTQGSLDQMIKASRVRHSTFRMTHLLWSSLHEMTPPPQSSPM